MTVVSQVAQSASGRPGAEQAQAAPVRAASWSPIPADVPQAPSGPPDSLPSSEDSVAARLALLRARDRQFDEGEPTPPTGTDPTKPVPSPATRAEPGPDVYCPPERPEPTQRPPAWAYPAVAGPPNTEPSDQEWISRLEARARELERENIALRAHRDQVVGEYLAVRASTSWRVGWLATTPLRLIRRIARGLAGQRR